MRNNLTIKSMHMFRLEPEPIMETIIRDIELISILVNTNDCDKPFRIAAESLGILSFMLNESSTENAKPNPRNTLLKIFSRKT